MTILVTGARGALGSHVVSKFKSEGHDVIELDHQDGDLSKSDVVRQLIAPHVHKIEAVVHCAGGFRWSKIEDLKDEELEFLISANLKSAFYLAREILPAMKKRGFGRFVFVGARSALGSPGAGMGAYAASKAGLHCLVQALADEVKDLDINVNAVLPSIIDTPANRRDMPNADFKAWVSPIALADLIFELTQKLGKPIHGALIPVAGRS